MSASPILRDPVAPQYFALLILFLGVESADDRDDLILASLHRSLALPEQPKSTRRRACVTELSHLLGRVTRIQNQKHQRSVLLNFDPHYRSAVPLMLQVKWRDEITIGTAFEVFEDPSEEFGMASAGARRPMEVDQLAFNAQEGEEGYHFGSPNPLPRIHQFATQLLGTLYIEALRPSQLDQTLQT